MPKPIRNQPDSPASPPPRDAVVTVQRDGAIEVARAEGDQSAAVVRISVSSETPCLCYRWWNDQYQRVLEILDHGHEAIDRSRIVDGLVIRDQHYGDQVGLIAAPAVKDGKLGGAVEWCSGARAQELRQDCEKKLRRNVSVEGIVDPTSYRLEGEQSGIPVVRAMRWTPLAAALVAAAPADPSVGVGRTITPPTIIATRKDPDMHENQTPPVDPVAQRNEEVHQIFLLARQQNIDPECTGDAIKRGITPQAFGMEILSGKAAKVQAKPVQAAPVTDVVSPKEIKRYSLYRAIQSLHTGENSFEREVSDALAKAWGKPAQGLYMPNVVERVASGVMSVADAYGSASLVQTEYRGFVEMLRAALALDKLGISYITGAVGDIEIPKQTGGATAYWVARDGSVTASNAAIGLLKASPKTVGARTLIGRSMLKQSNMSAEAFTQRDLTNAMAASIETKAIAGLGGNELTGLKLATGLNAATVTTPGSATWANILTFEAMIRADNAGELGAKKWAAPSDVIANLKGRNKGTDGEWICYNQNGQDYIDGKPIYEANNFPAKSLWFGVWSELLMILWGAVDLASDPYSSSATGGVYITALQDLDTIVRNPVAFATNAAVIA